MENIADYLYSRRSQGCSPEMLAEILGSIGWLMDDDGSEISAALRQWLESGDAERVRVALAYSEGLFRTREEAEQLLRGAGVRFSELRPRCDELLQAWSGEVSR